MYDMNSILAAMKEGKTADDIAKEFTDALNAARNELDRQRKEAEEATGTKREEARNIVNLVKNFVTNYYNDKIPSKYLDIFSMETTLEDADALIQEFDNFMPMLPMIFALIDFEDVKNQKKEKLAATPSIRSTHPTSKKTIKTLTGDEANKIIQDFLNKIF